MLNYFVILNLLVSLWKPAESLVLRLGTQNIYLCGNGNPKAPNILADIVEKNELDVVFLQEVLSRNCVRNTLQSFKNRNFIACAPEIFGSTAVLVNGYKFRVLRSWHPSLLKSLFTRSHFTVCQVQHLLSNQLFTIVSVHLSSEDYGPYFACGLSKIPDKFSHLSLSDAIREMEEDRRSSILKNILKTIGTGHLTFLGGDLNSPSHLDYTTATAHNHCGAPFTEWPTTVLLEKEGFTDAYRSFFTDERKHPGFTWSPHKTSKSLTRGIPEPQDRIDYIFYKTSLGANVTDAYVYDSVGTNVLWPFDHRLVVSELRI